MVEVIHENWLDYLLEELEDTKHVLLISPFVTNNIVKHLIDHSSEAKIKLVTRYNLNDFRSKVSSLSALKKLVGFGAEIKGIKGLHSKVYTFDIKSTIIGSANFTSSGFFSNYEFGVISREHSTILESIAYFESLWRLDQEVLTISRINEWEKELRNTQTPSTAENLPDYGKKASIQGSLLRTYYIKLFGKNEYRVGLDYTSREEIEGSHCHWALTFSGKKGRPRKYNDGDVVYMARMLYGSDYSIFGKGIAFQHVDSRDVASQEDIDEIDWKEDWPIYIRVHDTEFIDGTMADCPKMSELIDEVQYDSFDKTRKRFLEGEENINAWNSLRQQADVQLSEIGAEWVEQKFQEAKSRHGSVPEEFITNLYPGSLVLLPQTHE